MLDMDGRRERLEGVVASLQSGEIRPVDHVTARDQIEKRSRDRIRGDVARASALSTPRRLGLGSVGEAIREFGCPVGPVLLAHPAHAFQQAHAARSPEPDPAEAGS